MPSRLFVRFERNRGVSTDLVYSGHCLIAENGQMFAESERFELEGSWIFADIDTEYLAHERSRNASFKTDRSAESIRNIKIELPQSETLHESKNIKDFVRPVSRTPFVPEDELVLKEHCKEVFALQTMGLVQRLRHTQSQSVIIGVSGGLDSTLALLVIIKAFEKLSLDRKRIFAVTLPGPGTTEGTLQNARALINALGLQEHSICIKKAVKDHLLAIGRDTNSTDITFENIQARERTQILLSLANANNGLLVGTSDLSESALGWCTYGGDHLSMYHINIGVPKHSFQNSFILLQKNIKRLPSVRF